MLVLLTLKQKVYATPVENLVIIQENAGKTIKKTLTIAAEALIKIKEAEAISTEVPVFIVDAAEVTTNIHSETLQATGSSSTTTTYRRGLYS